MYARKMTTTEELFEFVEHHYDVVLKKHAFWNTFAKSVDLNTGNEDAVMDTLIECFSGDIFQDEQQAKATDLLFMGIALKKSTEANKDFWKTPKIVNLFRIWTQAGTRDISYANSLILKDPLTALFDAGGKTQERIALITFLSTNLWMLFETAIFTVVPQLSYANGLKISSELAIFRNAPHRTDLYDKEDVESLYGLLCCLNANDKPNLARLTNILTGHHHHEMAWRIALKGPNTTDRVWSIIRRSPNKNDLGIEGEWMNMLSTFSSLELDPKNHEAWRFIEALYECVEGDESGQELIAALAEKKPIMSQAFERIWSVAKGIESGDARYTCAIAIFESYTESSENLTIPEL